jgi:hypothetical protein
MQFARGDGGDGSGVKKAGYIISRRKKEESSV